MSHNQKQMSILLAVDNNGRSINALVSQYTVFFKQQPESRTLLGEALNFRHQASLLQINELEQVTLGKKDWKKVVKGYEEILNLVHQYKKDFNDAQNLLLEKDSRKNRENLEEKALKYLRSLEAAQNCQKKLATMLNDSIVNLQYLETQQKWLNTEISIFNKTLNNLAFAIAERQITSLRKENIDLKTTLANLHQHYTSAYDSNYGVGTFWRWLKNIFQKSERNQEINFLAAVSHHKDCTDAQRMQVIALVHDKIMTCEFFGQNSKLQGILTKLLGTTVGFKKDEHSLAELLDQDEALRNAMPESLRNFYNENKEDYRKIGSVEFIRS
ncbi:hypothetical protein [Legionella cardiaca]|uniref:Coiled-coil protein n=1 Tax=Legionella cardiaca TaxID=1071983 RepID=A0ABY8AU90_9GAMM|nr:hypothetical protein [Legionella cardiaca]WED44239.1 hypothetical protein PXX05_05495 [Legionella cardiaca]